MFVGEAGNLAGAPVGARGALGFRDALERGTGRQVTGVGRVYSGEDRMEGTQVFAERRDRSGRGGRWASHSGQ